MVGNISGGHHNLFLDPSGSVWSCGYNKYGQLGLGDVENRNVPTKITGLPKITSVSAGEYFSLFLDEKGFVWSCGLGECGFLGLGDNYNRKNPEKIKSISNIKLICSYVCDSFRSEERRVGKECRSRW